MKNLTVKKNDNIEIAIAMQPSDAIDEAILGAMAAAATNNPADVRMSYTDGVATFSVGPLCVQTSRGAR